MKLNSVVLSFLVVEIWFIALGKAKSYSAANEIANGDEILNVDSIQSSSFQQLGENECAPNTTWVKCSSSGGKCADNCQNYIFNQKNRRCVSGCRGGCDPKEGYAFVEGQSGQAITISECPLPECGNNAYWNEKCSLSGKSCAKNCKNRNPTQCRDNCEAGCDPIGDYVFREGQSGHAIRFEDCPVITTTPAPVQLDTSDECDLMNLIPGIVTASKAVDITRLNFFPKDDQMTGLNGFGDSIIRLSCRKNRSFSNPFVNNSKYFIPDEVQSVNVEPSGQLIQTVTVHQSIDSLKKSLDIHGGLSLKKESLGEFSLSGGYQDSKEKILTSDFTIIDISAVAGAISVNFRPFAILNTTYGFPEMLSMLSDNYREDPSFYDLMLDNYGTHYFSSAKLGGYLVMRTMVVTSSLNESATETIYGNIAVNFKNMVGGDLSGKNVENRTQVEFNQNTRTNYYYYGGRTGITDGPMKPVDFNQWVRSVQDAPWLFAGKLTPISFLIQNKTIRKQMDLAIEAKMNKAFLEDLQGTLTLINQENSDEMKTIRNLSLELLPDTKNITSVKEGVDKLVKDYLKDKNSTSPPSHLLGSSQYESSVNQPVESNIHEEMLKALKNVFS